MDREELIKDIEKQMREPRNEYVVLWFSEAEYVLELLKEHEAVTIKKTKEHGFGVYGGICQKCQNWIQSPHSFCGFCGQAVKWE